MFNFAERKMNSHLQVGDQDLRRDFVLGATSFAGGVIGLTSIPDKSELEKLEVLAATAVSFMAANVLRMHVSGNDFIVSMKKFSEVLTQNSTTTRQACLLNAGVFIGGGIALMLAQRN